MRRYPHFIAFGLLVLFGSYACPENICAKPAPEVAKPVWPGPPDEPRFSLERVIAKPSDAGTKSSGIKKLSTWIAGEDADGELNRPFGINADESGGFCITDTGDNSVAYFDPQTRQWSRWRQVENVPFVAPTSVAKSGKYLYVADSGMPGIVAFDVTGKLLFRIGEPLVRPVAVAATKDRLFVVDAGSHCVLQMDLHGKVLSSFGTRGSGPGEFNYPTHIATDRAGNIYVTDFINRRILVFDPEGGYLRQIGKPGDGPGCFSRPKGIAVDATGNVFVVDAVFDNFQIFDPSGRLLLAIGHDGKGLGEFSLPNGIAITPDGLIYVTDVYNSRIQVFQPVVKK